MQELIDKLKSEHGLTDEQSHGILSTVTNFIKEKFPMVEGMLGKLFHQDAPPAAATEDAPSATATTDETSTSDVASDPVTTDNTMNKGGSLLDKIKNAIPGGAEKVEEFAKDKLGGLFGGNK